MSVRTRNPAASIRQHLLNLAKANGEEFQQMLVRYALERLLYRLALSSHRERFVLKGALLFRLWFATEQRPTRDADFLGLGDAAPAHLVEVFRDIAMVDCGTAEDGLVYQPDTVRAESIRKAAGYPGIRVSLTAILDAAQIPMQCDIGFGDVVTPAVSRQAYPTLLDMPAPVLAVYPPETVVAEKLEALVKFGAFNSRLKDYFDLWMLMRHEALDRDVLPVAVHATFARRQTMLPAELPVGLSGTFATAKAGDWRAFLERQGLEAPPLADVVGILRDACWPVLRAASAIDT